MLALLLFLMIFCLLGLPFTEWGFRTDAWANVYHYIIRQWSDIGGFFTENLEDIGHPSNGVKGPQAFFSILYRPLLGLFYHPQYCLWGANPYGYFLVMIALHALLSVLLFYFFSQITSIGWSFFCAALYGFHPSLWDWMGWISAQSYVIEGLLFVSIIMALHRYFVTQRYWWYVISCLLFACTLFLKEMLVIFPFWLVFALHFYHSLFRSEGKTRSFFSLLPVYVRQTSGFFLGVFLYLFVRISLFPITRETKTLTFEPTIASFVSRMISRVFDFITYGIDMMGLSWVPNGVIGVKIAIFVAITTLFFYALYNSTQKKLVIFLLISIPLFSWPALIMHHKGRYLYVALMFVMAIIAILSSSYRGCIVPMRRATTLSLMCLLGVHSLFLFGQFKNHERDFSVSTKATFALAKHIPVDRPLCFFALPNRLFGCSAAPAIKLLRNDITQPVYQYDTKDAIPKKVFDQKPLLITWDYEKKDFYVYSGDCHG